jgi:hypothetical protein
MSIRKNLLKYENAAVNVASATASDTGWAARWFRRKAETCRLNLTTNAPYRPCNDGPLFKQGGGCGNLTETYPEDSNDNKEDDFEKVPLAIICDLEEYKLSCSKGIHSLWWIELISCATGIGYPQRALRSRREHKRSSSTWS